MMNPRNYNTCNKKEGDKKRVPFSYVMKRKNDRINEVIQVSLNSFLVVFCHIWDFQGHYEVNCTLISLKNPKSVHFSSVYVFECYGTENLCVDKR